MHLKRIVFLVIVSLHYFTYSLVAQTNSLSKKEITNLTNQASQYLKVANFSKSLEVSKVALRKAIESKDFLSTTISYNTIAANYAELAQFDKAIYYYDKAMVYANKINNDTLTNKINNNLGNIYCFEKKQYLKGIGYYENTIKYSEKIADSNQIFMTKLNIAWAYFDIGQFKEGYPSLKFVNTYKEKFGNESNISAINMLNGMYSSHKNDNAKASSFFLNAIKLGIDTNQKSDLSYAHLEYSKHLSKTGDHKKAYENLTRYNVLTDELYNKEKLDKANIAGMNIELDEYRRQIDKFAIEKKANLKIVEKSKTIVLLFIAIVMVLLFLLYTLIKNNNFKKKSNKELSTANKQLLIAKEKAEESTKLKSQFVSTISHELRTPLYGVVGITDILIDENKDLANNPYLKSLKFSAKYLLSLVNDILQMNKIEDNKIVLEDFTFNIADEIDMVQDSLKFLAQSNNNNLIIIIDPTIPEYLIGDKLRLSQIIVNLVGNALKFTKNGVVTIHVNLLKIEQTSCFLEFRIVDNGIGIAKEDQGKIFEKFVQVGRKETDYQGTGLGLSIVKQLLGLFNSDVTLTSAINEGTEFRFEIAFEYNPGKTIELINNIRVNVSESKAINVLVVEDNLINQLVTKKTIEKNGYKCKVVDNGYAALELLDLEAFDIILMDINMPLINGFETTKKIRSKGIVTPIIALTAFDKSEITEDSLAAGMNDIIVKPFDSAKLFTIITTLTSRKLEVI